MTATGQGGVLPRAVISSVEEAGYLDSLMVCEPRAGRSVGTFTTQEPGQRVDYIFGFGVEFTSAWVEVDRLAKFASDHFPVGAEIELERSSRNAERGTRSAERGGTEAEGAEKRMQAGGP